MKMYSRKPSDYMESSDWTRRKVLKPINVTFNISPPKGKKLGHWQAQKQHMIEQIQLFSIMSTDELYKLLLITEQGKLPQMFKPIIETFLSNKRAFEPPLETIVVDGEIEFFDYENSFRRVKKNTSALVNKLRLSVS